MYYCLNFEAFMLLTHISKNNYCNEKWNLRKILLNERNQLHTVIPKFLDATETSCCFICFKALIKVLTS